MINQKGQSAVEFAIIMPMFFLMCFALIYAGMLFMDYLQYNNAARAIARAAITSPTEEINTDDYINPLTHLYKLKENPQIISSDSDVTVQIELILNDEDLPPIFNIINFPPKELKPIKYTMQQE